MANLKHAIPASLRKQVESSQFAHKLMARSRTVNESLPAVKTRFARLPEEPEDAKITGVTRSLARRLLALNLPKVKSSKVLLPAAGKMA